MPRSRHIVSSFSAGELSPGAQDRIDDPIWHAGAEQLSNLVVRREGGLSTRPGVRILRIDDTGTATPEIEEGAAYSVMAGSAWSEYEALARPEDRDHITFRSRGNQVFDGGMRTVSSVRDPDTGAVGPDGGFVSAYSRLVQPLPGTRDVFTGRGFTGMLNGSQVVDLDALAVVSWTVKSFPIDAITVHGLSSYRLGTLFYGTAPQGQREYRAAWSVWGKVAGLDGWWSLTPRSETQVFPAPPGTPVPLRGNAALVLRRSDGGSGRIALRPELPQGAQPLGVREGRHERPERCHWAGQAERSGVHRACHCRRGVQSAGASDVHAVRDVGLAAARGGGCQLRLFAE